MNYIGKKMISKDGYEFEIISQETFDKPPNKCRYKVRFIDGFEAVYTYSTLRDGCTRKSKDLDVTGSKFTTLDGYDFVVVEKVDNLSNSRSNYKVKFLDDGYSCIYSSSSLRKGCYRKSKDRESLIGKEYTSSDGYKFKITRQVSLHSKLNKCKFEIEFLDDHTKAVYCFGSINQGIKKYKSGKAYINEEFVSSDGYKCKITKQLTSGNCSTTRRYQVQFEDGFINDFAYGSLRSGKFRRYTRKKNYINQKYTSKDGYVFEIVSKVESEKNPSSIKYLVKFEDGYEKVVSYSNIAHNIVLKYSFHDKYSDSFNKSFKSIDGLNYTIVKNLTPERSLNKSFILLEFEDGFKDVRNFRNVLSYNVKRHSRDYIHVDFSNDYGDYHFCECTRCKMKNWLTYDEIAKHKLKHYLEKETA